MADPVSHAGHAETEPADLWQSRDMLMRCWSCLYFVPKGEGKLGRCRRRAPTLGGWPVVYPQDWCGEHKLDERKLL